MYTTSEESSSLKNRVVSKKLIKVKSFGFIALSNYMSSNFEIA
jgi:hypothetical protein